MMQPMAKTNSLTPRSLTRTIVGEETGTEYTITLRKLRTSDLFPWKDREQEKVQQQARDRVPFEGISPDEQDRRRAEADNLSLGMVGLKQLILNGEGAYEALRIALAKAEPEPITEPDDVEAFFDAVYFRQNLKDGAILSGLFSPAEVAYHFREFESDPVRDFVNGLAFGDTGLIASAADEATKMVETAEAERAAKEAKAKAGVPEVPDPNPAAPAVSPTGE